MSKIRLVVDVDYEDNGTSVDRLKANLRGAVFTAIDNGMLTEESSAEVRHYEMNVDEVYEPEVPPPKPERCTTHHLACDCREAMFEKAMRVHRKCVGLTMKSNADLRLQMGELTTQEIRTLKAALAYVLK